MELVKEFLQAIPAAATNEWSFLSYLAVVIAWFLLGWKIKRNKNLLLNLEALPEKDRLKALEMEMGVGRLRTGLSPEQWIRSRIHTYLLIGFVVLCIALVVVTVLAGLDLYGKSSVAVSVYSEQPNNQWKSDTLLTYEYAKSEEGTSIFPKMNYLEKVQSGQRVNGLSYTWEPFSWSFPSVSFKITNNSKSTIFVTELVFDVRKNDVNKDPLLYVKSKYYFGKFSIFNDGWGKVLLPELRLSLSHPDECGENSKNTSMVKVDDFYESETISINEIVSSELRSSLLQCSDNIDWVCIGGSCTTGGVDDLRCNDKLKSKICENVDGQLSIAQINEMVADANQFRDKDDVVTKEDIYYKRDCYDIPACVVGDLMYNSESNHKSNFKFKTHVSLGRPGVGVPRPPSYFYDVFIEAGKPNQKILLPVSHEIKPGDTDHFVVNIGSDKSATMDLLVSVLGSNSEKISSQDLKLDILIPRSGTRFVNGKSVE